MLNPCAANCATEFPADRGGWSTDGEIDAVIEELNRGDTRSTAPSNFPKAGV